jgi:hypothetical protein
MAEIPDTPENPKKELLCITVPSRLLEKLDAFRGCIFPQMTRSRFLREYFMPQFEDWLDRWMEFKKPPEGDRVNVENVNIFPPVLIERKRWVRR